MTPKPNNRFRYRLTQQDIHFRYTQVQTFANTLPRLIDLLTDSNIAPRLSLSTCTLAKHSSAGNSFTSPIHPHTGSRKAPPGARPMTATQAHRLTRRIQQSPRFQVTSTRHYGGSSYGLDVLSQDTGDRLVIDSTRQWQSRLRSHKRGAGSDWF